MDFFLPSDFKTSSEELQREIQLDIKLTFVGISFTLITLLFYYLMGLNSYVLYAVSVSVIVMCLNLFVIKAKYNYLAPFFGIIISCIADMIAKYYYPSIYFEFHLLPVLVANISAQHRIKFRVISQVLIISTLIVCIYFNFQITQSIPLEEHTKELVMAYILLISFLPTFAIFMEFKKKENEHKNFIKTQAEELLEQKEELLTEIEKNYDLQLAQKQKDLEASVAENKIKLELKETLIKNLKVLEEGDTKGLKSLILDMTQQVQREKKLDLMEGNNDVVNSEFFNRISALGKFSKTELEICSYIRLNLSTKEIAEIRGGTEDSIRVTRSRIRKKLGLSSTDDMYTFISQV